MNRSFVKTNLLILALLGTSFFLNGTGFPMAQAAQSAENKLQKIVREIHSLRNLLNQDQGTIQKERAELQVVETTYQQQRDLLRDLEQKLTETQFKHDNLLFEYQQKKEKIATHRLLLSRQLASAHLRGQYDFAKLLLSQKTSESIRRQITYYHYLNQARQSAIENAITHLQQLQQLEKRLKTQAHTQNQLLEQTKEKQQQLDNTRANRLLVIEQITSKIENQKSLLKQLVNDKNQLEKLLKELQNLFADIPTELDEHLPFAQLKGLLPWPVGGSGQSKQLQNGVLLHRTEGTNVRAIAKGRVVFSDWFRGLGFLIIVDHGNDYMSLYGHNQTLLAGVGQWVRQNETIARVGQSGGAATPALYFEIRVNGKPQDPVLWCQTQGR